MRRFYVEDMTEDSSSVSLKADELHHLKVLRLKEGDKVALFNGRGLEAQGVIRSIGKLWADVAIKGTVPSRAESSLNISLICALTKAQKPDLIVQKATELGVRSIIFYYAGHSVPVLRAARTAEKVERWRRIAIGAVKQCRRSIVPALACRGGLALAMDSVAGAGVKLLFYEGGGMPVAEAVASLGGRVPKDLAILIGPEGGFTDEELSLAGEAGYITCGLGPRILRVETAAIVTTAILQNLLGDI